MESKPKFFTKSHLAKVLGMDPRTIEKLPLVPAATANNGLPLYDMSAKAQIETYLAGRKHKGRI